MELPRNFMQGFLEVCPSLSVMSGIFEMGDRD